MNTLQYKEKSKKIRRYIKFEFQLRYLEVENFFS